MAKNKVETSQPAVATQQSSKKPAAKKTSANATAAAGMPASPTAVSKYQKFTIKRIHRSAIQLATYNPRTIDKHGQKRLRESLKGHGLVETLVVNEQTGNTLVGGHQRIQQLDALEGGQDYYLDVSTIDVPLEQEQALNIALNNPLLAGQYDLDAIEQILGQPDFPVAATGFDRASLVTLLDEGVLDGIFGGEAAQQAAAEQPVIAELLDIRQSGREVEEADKQREARRQEDIQRMREGRKEFIAKSADSDASEFMIVLVGDKEHDVDQFLMALGLPVDNRYIDMRIVADKLGIKLGNASNAPAAAPAASEPSAPPVG